MSYLIKKLRGISGFVGTTYAVYNKVDSSLIKIFMSKKEAKEFADKYNKENKK